MTHKHFEAIAAHLRTIEDPINRADVAKGLATVFLTLNPRFNRARFLAACEVATDGGEDKEIGRGILRACLAEKKRREDTDE